MPNPETSSLYDKAVLWPALGTYDRYGAARLDEPTVIDIRWNWTRRQITDSNGNTVVLDAVIVVKESIPMFSKLWLAPDPTQDALEQWYGTGSSGTDTELCEVKTDQTVKDIRGRAVFRSYGLMRFKNILPAGAG